MINPTGTTTNIDPGEDTAFGFYSEWPFFSGRKAYTEDALNTWDAALPHHVRVYPLTERPTAPSCPNAYVVATEEAPGARSTSRTSSSSSATSSRSRRPRPNAVLKVGQPGPDAVRGPGRLQPDPDHGETADQRVADTGTVRISNTGTGPLQVTGLQPHRHLRARQPARRLPFTLAPGAIPGRHGRFAATEHEGRTTAP